MAQTGTEREARLDLLLGKIALERGLVTQPQLREALAEQSLGVARGRKLPRPLGAIFASRKILTDAQVVALTAEIDKVLAGEDEGRRNDAFLGQILVDADLVASKHLDLCLVVQAEMVEQGHHPIPRLGEILVQQGFATGADIDQALALQKAMVRVCTSCGKSCSLSGSKGPEHCPLCGGALQPHLAPGSLSGSTQVPAAPEPAPPPVSGPKRLGKYEIHRVLGRGGMGVVYEALDTRLNRKVALKMMHRAGGSDPRESSHEVERFVREAQVAAKLRHPNIVSIYETGIVEGEHYIAMEHIEGLSMAQWRKTGSITIRQQVRVLRDVALAVHQAHLQGITHRDLKPQNVMIDSRIKAYVTDFGLAKKAGQDVSASLTAEGAILGTPSYMSPEQAKGRKTVGKRTDVWALGVMLYEILVGRPPFRGETPMAILMKILREPVAPPTSVAPSLLHGPLYRPLEAICMAALRKEPGERTATAKEFADDLTKWLKGEVVRVVERRPRRAPKWALAVGAAAVLGLVAAAIAGLAGPGSGPSRTLLRAREYLDAGQPDAARQLFERVLAREPGNAEAVTGLQLAKALLDAQAAREEVADLKSQLEKSQKGAAPEDERRRIEDRLRAAEERAKRMPVPEPARLAPAPVSRAPTTWLVLGPFDNPGGRGMDVAYEPEARIDLPAAAAGKAGKIFWKTATAAILEAGSARLDLARECDPRDNVVAYAVIHVRARTVVAARLLVGSDDGVKVWLDGGEIHRVDRSRPLKVEEDSIPCRLVAGWNRLLFKVTQGTGGFELALRITAPDGRPIEGLEYDPFGDLPGRPGPR